MIIQLQAGTIFKEIEGYLNPENSWQSFCRFKRNHIHPQLKCNNNHFSLKFAHKGNLQLLTPFVPFTFGN